MNIKQIRLNLYKILRKTGIPRERIEENATYNNDLFIDDVDMTCFLFYLETEFDLTIDAETLPKIYSVGSTIDYLQKCYA